MSTPLFGAPNTGGSFTEQMARARAFFDTARGTAEPAAVEVDPTHGLVADAPTAATGVDAAASVTTAAGNDPDGLAAAARAAAQQSIADPAYAGVAAQQVEVVVQPRVLVQGQPGPIVVPVDVAVPAARTNVTVAPAQAVMLDAATGQVVAAPASAAAAQAAEAAQVADTAAPTRGFRSWGIEDLVSLGRGRGTAAPVAATTPEVVAEAPVAAAAGGSWRARIDDMIAAARGSAPAAATEVAEAAPDAARTSLLDRIRANTAGIGEMLTRTAPDAAPLGDDAARFATPGFVAQLDDLIRAARAVNPKG